MILSQSLVKDLEREEYCPHRFYEQWELKNPLLKIKSDDLDRGNYFECRVLGSVARKGEEVLDLPRLASGAKSVDHKRIDTQAERCSKILFDKTYRDYLGFRIVNTQMNLALNGRTGTFDIVAHDENNDLWIIDLKLTRDLTSDRSKYRWGNDWGDLDLIQLAHYQDLYHDYYGEYPRMGLLVMDYSPQMRVEFGEVLISNRKRQNKEQRFKDAEYVINMYKEHGWIKVPSLKECESCPLQCDQRMTESEIVKKVVNY